MVMETYKDKIRGSIFGGAIGDALGYPVEFMSVDEIISKYGTNGITEYALHNGKALISDDTQMTLFTANGVLVARTRFENRGIGGFPSSCVPMSYQDWLKTQTSDYIGLDMNDNPKISWLLDVPELHSRRAPGNTCMQSLFAHSGLIGRRGEKYLKNKSKGCGAVMRIAPLGLYYDSLDINRLMDEAVEISKITHGHSLAYLPAALLTYILNKIVYYTDDSLSLKQIIVEAQMALVNHYKDDEYIDDFFKIIELSIRLAENEKDDRKNIAEIGEGWVGDEALAIAIYCSLKYHQDFSKGIIAAVNHGGDSDSTGAIAGNILGAWNGYRNIESKWLDDIELFDVIDEIATDLCQGFPIEDKATRNKWTRKYVDMKWR